MEIEKEMYQQFRNDDNSCSHQYKDQARMLKAHLMWYIGWFEYPHLAANWLEVIMGF